MNPVFTVSNHPGEEAKKVISDGLATFNDAQLGYTDLVPLHVIVRDGDSGEIIAEAAARHRSA
jgi:hypothetical protein